MLRRSGLSPVEIRLASTDADRRRLRAFSVRYNMPMKSTVHDLLQQAMELPPEERADLAGSLLDSLEEGTDPDVEQAWQEVAARRIEELASGKAKGVPWEEVRKRLYEITGGPAQP
jgi:putative addiction module component (TIGR02574 family)